MENITRFLKAPATHFFLFGPRGTGKSTWLRGAFPEALWLDLLAPESERTFSARPERLSQVVQASHAATVVIDEVQRVPELLPVIHQLIEDPSCGARFVLTGSSSRKLKRTGVDLLAGRALLERMNPFLAAELGVAFDLKPALELGMVPLVRGSADPQATLRSYVALYVQEEVKAEGLVRRVGDFARFLETISFSQASPLNLAEVARECEVQRKTVESYLSVLEDLLLCFQLPVFTRRAKRQLASHPKFFYFDVGVYRSLRPTGPLDSASEAGGVALESLVAQHLRGWNELGGARHQLAYWRTRGGSEVDFIVYGPLGFWAIEVKHSASAHATDLRGLRAFKEDYPEAAAILLYRGELAMEIEGVSVLPVEPFLRGLTPGQAIGGGEPFTGT